jgi:hypothetical protein
LKGGGGGSEKRKRERGEVTVCYTGAIKGNLKRGGEEVRHGKGRKEQSQYATQGQPKGAL